MHSCLHLPGGSSSIIILLQKEKHFSYLIQALQRLSTCLTSTELMEKCMATVSSCVCVWITIDWCCVYILYRYNIVIGMQFLFYKG